MLTDKHDHLVNYTTTWRPPNRDELKREIIMELCKYVRHPWYAKRKHILQNALHAARALNLIDEINKS